MLYKPKIPWWEWIQEWGDVRYPVAKLRDRRRWRDPQRDLVAGALGAEPQPEVLGKLTLGAAALSAAVVRGQVAAASKDRGDVAARAACLLPDVVAHAAGLLAVELKSGVAASKRLL